jgi:3-isopropylmalate dehydrogenase
MTRNTMKVAVFAGDGIGPEIMREAVRVLETLALPGLEMTEGLVGAAAFRAHGHPLPPESLAIAKASDAILFGSVGDFAMDHLPRDLRPEQAILGLRKEMQLFANLRPAKVYKGLEHMSSLKPEIASAIDLLIVREANGDVYFGNKGIRILPDGRRQGFDHTGFRTAMGRRKKLCSVDKANVLDTSQLWRDVILEVAPEYPEVELSHLYVDNAAMQLVKDPGQFDTIVTGNMFGDILSDQASMCVGSIGLLASATMAEGTYGLYEPIHGSAPDIAGQGVANPMAQILSAAMMLRHSFAMESEARRIEAAVEQALADGVLGRDLGGSHTTTAIGDAVVARL